MNKDQFIEEVFEIAFGDSAINRDFSFEEVLEELSRFSDEALKWDSIPDEDKEQWEKAYERGDYILMEHDR